LVGERKDFFDLFLIHPNIICNSYSLAFKYLILIMLLR
jgi:hypothetical protein